MPIVALNWGVIPDAVTVNVPPPFKTCSWQPAPHTEEASTTGLVESVKDRRVLTDSPVEIPDIPETEFTVEAESLPLINASTKPGEG